MGRPSICTGIWIQLLEAEDTREIMRVTDLSERVEGTRKKTCEDDRASSEGALRSGLKVVISGTDDEGENLYHSVRQHGRTTTRQIIVLTVDRL